MGVLTAVSVTGVYVGVLTAVSVTGGVRGSADGYICSPWADGGRQR